MSAPDPVRVCDRDDLAPGEGLRVTVVNPPIAIFLTDDGDVYAIDDTCTHQDASLADGFVEGCWVECPLHESRFDLRDGSVDAPPAKKPVRSHEVTLDGDAVYVRLSTQAPNLPPGMVVSA